MRKTALPIPGVPINITEKRETILTSFNQVFESPPHDDQPILPQGRQAKGGNTKDKRDLSEGWQGPSCNQAYSHLYLRGGEAKEGGGSLASFPISAMFVFQGYLLGGSLFCRLSRVLYLMERVGLVLDVILLNLANGFQNAETVRND